ncbi:MAG TPA: phosphotransferase [Jatrophihabitans sp.]|jgi:homoserine kinase type II
MAEAPQLEMLWEVEDAHRALETRFGFGDPASADRWVRTVLERFWGVRARSCERIVISDRNALAWVATPSGRLIAKWSVAPEVFPRLTAIARLTSRLDAAGLPVSAPLPALDGALQVEADGVSMFLQREIEAALLDTAEPDQVRAAGAVLARLQDALASDPDPDRVAAAPRPQHSLPVRIANWLESGAEHVPVMARDTLRRLVADAPTDALPIQLGHFDFRSANILCAGADVAAVIDFEQARFDHRVVELARSAVLLGTRYRQWGPSTSEVRAAFLAGYESVRALNAIEAAWWEILLLWHTLAFVPPGEDPTGWGSSALSHARELAAGG